MLQPNLKQPSQKGTKILVKGGLDVVHLFDTRHKIYNAPQWVFIYWARKTSAQLILSFFLLLNDHLKHENMPVPKLCLCESGKPWLTMSCGTPLAVPQLSPMLSLCSTINHGILKNGVKQGWFLVLGIPYLSLLHFSMCLGNWYPPFVWFQNLSWSPYLLGLTLRLFRLTFRYLSYRVINITLRFGQNSKIIFRTYCFFNPQFPKQWNHSPILYRVTSSYAHMLYSSTVRYLLIKYHSRIAFGITMYTEYFHKVWEKIGRVCQTGMDQGDKASRVQQCLPQVSMVIGHVAFASSLSL